jgi:glycosyltransferase involved in cell wall biosynthesis
MLDRAQTPPAFETVAEGILKFRWPGAECDFGYPLEVSSSMYRGEQILPLLKEINFRNPNTLEEAIYQNCNRFQDSHPFMLCANTSLALAVPANRVQEEVQSNRAGSNPAFSAPTLAAAFAAGQRIDTAALDGLVPRACHQEVEFELKSGAAPVPLISVIVPCYNHARFLPEAVESVVAQTLADWEMIIIDDGSPDNTAAVAQQLIARHGQRIRLLRLRNGGLARARNAALLLAAGAYILPLDADDRILPTMLERTAAVLEAEPKIDIVYTDVSHFGVVEKTIEAAEFDFKKLCAGNQLNYCSLYRWEAWERSGGYNPNMVWGYEDWNFWVSCGEHDSLARHISGALLQYRVKDASMYTVAAANDKALRARIILNHPNCYDAPSVSAARAIWTQPAMPTPPAPPKVSVVIPTHDRPVFLARALQSVLDQTMQDFEILVTNDRGIDVSSVISRFSSKARITYFPEPAGAGIAAARNTGLRAAVGKYVAHLDDDDLFLPDHLETLVTFLESTGHKAAYTDASCAEEEWVDGGYQVTKREVLYSAEWDNDRILVQNFVPTLCFMHERSCAIAAGDFDEELSTHEDWEYWIRLGRVCAPVHIKKVTCEFRKRKDGSSMTSGHRADFLRTIRMVYKKHQALVAGHESLRAQQKKFLRGLEEELGVSARISLADYLRRLFRRGQAR